MGVDHRVRDNEMMIGENQCKDDTSHEIGEVTLDRLGAERNIEPPISVPKMWIVVSASMIYHCNPFPGQQTRHALIALCLDHPTVDGYDGLNVLITFTGWLA